jgi:DAK2 domain fusion protein YloV
VVRLTDREGGAGVLDLGTFQRFVDLATAGLGDAREEIDALNVYPVPDGDTGTNMFLTVSAGRDALVQATGGSPDADLDAALAAFARGSLLGARGNSGVILSQMLGALAERVSTATPEEADAVVVAESLRDATDASYAAVGTPVEGTILTVARAAADAAMAACATEPLGRTLAAAAAAAREALQRTPEQLKTLADAGVVDAGGRGLCVVLDAAETALTGRRRVSEDASASRRRIPVPLPSNDLTEDGPAYEVMYLLDADDAAIPGLRAALAPLGDSLVVVGGHGLWNVHVHVDDVGAAIEAGIDAGRPHRVRVTHFAEQVSTAREKQRTRKGRKVVAVTAGPGLEQVFTEAGAVVVPGGPGQRPSTGMIIEAIERCGAAEVVVLPNDADSIRTAEIAARTVEDAGDVRVGVVPSRAQVQGLAAMAVHEPGRSFDQDLLHMTATARHARHGAVTVAARRAMTAAGPCEPGDVLGVIEGDFALVGDDMLGVATGVVDRLVGGGGEMVTLVSGAGGEELAARVEQYVEREHPLLEVVAYDGGQARYPLLVAVE